MTGSDASADLDPLSYVRLDGWRFGGVSDFKQEFGVLKRVRSRKEEMIEPVLIICDSRSSALVCRHLISRYALCYDEGSPTSTALYHVSLVVLALYKFRVCNKSLPSSAPRKFDEGTL